MSSNNHQPNESSHINIKRSDGLSHDLLSVFSGIDMNSLSAASLDKSKNNTDIVAEEDTGSIKVHRSDGITHDIIKVFKANSASSSVGEATTKKPSQSKIDVPPSLAATTSYYPSAVRIVHMSVSKELIF